MYLSQFFQKNKIYLKLPSSKLPRRFIEIFVHDHEIFIDAQQIKSTICSSDLGAVLKTVNFSSEEKGINCNLISCHARKSYILVKSKRI